MPVGPAPSPLSGHPLYAEFIQWREGLQGPTGLPGFGGTGTSGPVIDEFRAAQRAASTPRPSSLARPNASSLSGPMSQNALLDEFRAFQGQNMPPQAGPPTPNLMQGPMNSNIPPMSMDLSQPIQGGLGTAGQMLFKGAPMTLSGGFDLAGLGLSAGALGAGFAGQPEVAAGLGMGAKLANAGSGIASSLAGTANSAAFLGTGGIGASQMTANAVAPALGALSGHSAGAVAAQLGPALAGLGAAGGWAAAMMAPAEIVKLVKGFEKADEAKFAAKQMPRQIAGIQQMMGEFSRNTALRLQAGDPSAFDTALAAIREIDKVAETVGTAGGNAGPFRDLHGQIAALMRQSPGYGPWLQHVTAPYQGNYRYTAEVANLLGLPPAPGAPLPPPGGVQQAGGTANSFNMTLPQDPYAAYRAPDRLPRGVYLEGEGMLPVTPAGMVQRWEGNQSGLATEHRLEDFLKGFGSRASKVF